MPTIFHRKHYNSACMIRTDIDSFLATIPTSVTVVAATKYIGSEDMITLMHHGVTNFGENRVDVFLEKYEALKDYHPTWHFIGHLQRNKAHLIVDKIDYLHSLDSLELAKIINEKRATPLNCFVEVSINLEETKNGVPFMEANAFVKNLLSLPNIHLVGLMMMAVKASDDLSLKNQFHRLAVLRDELEKEFQISLPYLSMGMSGDYQEAIEEGATHIRLGRILFNVEY